MYRKRILRVVLLILIVAQGSDASLAGVLRKLAEGVEPRERPVQISPSPGPVNSDLKESPQNAPVPDTSPKVSPIGTVTNERCKMSFTRCPDQKNLIACLGYSGSEPQELFLVVQNDGESTLQVNVTVLHVNLTFKDIKIPKHEAEKIILSANVGESPSIVLNAGNGDCVIHMGSPVSKGSFFTRFPSYASHVTPIYGAYLLFLTALIIGGSWACCKLGKSERQVDGVPYQELEMGQPDSLSAINVETAEGWDQGWDDNWDEEKAVKSPVGNHVGNVSANGLTSRSSNRDGWGNDWDD